MINKLSKNRSTKYIYIRIIKKKTTKLFLSVYRSFEWSFHGHSAVNSPTVPKDPKFIKFSFKIFN